jgi:hypothetical protein
LLEQVIIRLGSVSAEEDVALVVDGGNLDSCVA